MPARLDKNTFFAEYIGMKSIFNHIKPVCILIIVFAECMPVFSQSQEKSIARSYVVESEKLFKLEKYSRALSMAEKGLEFYPDAELFFIAASSIFFLDADGMTAREYAKNAVNLSSSLSFDERAKYYELYYKILYRQKEYSFIISNISDLIEKKYPVSAELYKLYLSSLKRSGKDVLINSVLESALAMFPDDPWFYIFSRFFYGVPVSDLFDYSSLSDDELSQLISMFFSRDNSSLFSFSSSDASVVSRGSAVFYAFILLNNPDSSELWNLFIQQGGYRHRELMLSLYKTKNIDVNRISHAYSFFKSSDHISWDVNGDTFAEYRIDMADSKISSLAYDENQDNRPELVINYEHSYPVNMYVYIDEQIWKISYDPYPVVVSVELITQSRHVEYKLIPMSLEIPVRGIPVESENWVLSSWGGTYPSFVIPVSDIIKYAMEINLYDSKSSNKPYLNMRLVKEKVSMLRARLLNGDAWDMVVWYKDGLPDYGKRDLDGDGFFEILDVYDEDGNVTKSSYQGFDSSYDIEYDYKDSSFLWIFKEGTDIKKIVTEDRWGGQIVFKDWLKALYK